MSDFETVKENTLKMIRNNERYEDLIDQLLLYAKEEQNYTLATMIGQCLDKIEKYEDINVS